MLQFSNPTLQIIAVLHDILEDTATTAEELKALGFRAEIIQAIQALTKQTGESRSEAAKRTALNGFGAQTISTLAFAEKRVFFGSLSSFSHNRIRPHASLSSKLPQRFLGGL